MASAFKTPVHDFQIWSNVYVQAKRLPLALIAVDDSLGARTRARIIEIKRCVGYAPASANDDLTDTLLRILQHPLWQRLYKPNMWVRGLAYRRSLRSGGDERVRLARAILAHPNAVFAYYSPTGGTARAGIVAASEGRKSYVAQTGEYVYIDVKILRFLLKCCGYGRTLINCVTNGHHRPGSEHHYGRAADIQEHTRGTYPAASATGCRVYDEDTVHDHVYSGSHP